MPPRAAVLQQQPATVRQPPTDGLHVWRIALSPAPSPSVAMTLPAEELARAGRLVDPAARTVVNAAQLASKSRNTPYAGMELPGRVVHVLFGGRHTVRDGVLA
jgi:hypothetical protein